MTPGNEELYQQREQRFNDIVALRKPDRIPVIPIAATYFPTRIKGVSNRDAGYDDSLRFRCLKEANLEFDWDMAVPTGLFFSASAFDAIGATQMRWPGGDLPDTAPFQFVEGEYVKADEYGDFLSNPDRFAVEKILPRIATNLEGLGQVPIPPLYWMAHSYYLLNLMGRLLALPPLRKAIDSLLAMSDAVAIYAAAEAQHIQNMAALGYPYVWGVPIIPAFDIVSEMYRGLKGSTLDMFRRPDELLGAIERAQQAQLGVTMLTMKLTGNPRVFIPMHRGADGFMSDEQFAKFYWPSFKALVLAIIDAGGTPLPLFEAGYTSRLKYLAEFPPGKVAGHFEKVDRKKFKEILGDTMCFWGNVPSSLLCTGTPKQVKEDVRELIELFGDTGALIIDTPLGIPDEARPENVHAMREAVYEYGVL